MRRFPSLIILCLLVAFVCHFVVVLCIFVLFLHLSEVIVCLFVIPLPLFEAVLFFGIFQFGNTLYLMFWRPDRRDTFVFTVEWLKRRVERRRCLRCTACFSEMNRVISVFFCCLLLCLMIEKTYANRPLTYTYHVHCYVAAACGSPLCR